MVDADETYLADSIENPSAKIVTGYRTTMPSYKEQLDREQVVALVAYVKSLGTVERERQGAHVAIFRNRPLLTSAEKDQK